MTVFITIVPVLLLAFVCTIGCFWSMRRIDRFLTDASDAKHAGQPQKNQDSDIRLPH
jgi:hypothetical protein